MELTKMGMLVDLYERTNSKTLKTVLDVMIEAEKGGVYSYDYIKGIYVMYNLLESDEFKLLP